MNALRWLTHRNSFSSSLLTDHLEKMKFIWNTKTNSKQKSNRFSEFRSPVSGPHSTTQPSPADFECESESYTSINSNGRHCQYHRSDQTLKSGFDKHLKRFDYSLTDCENSKSFDHHSKINKFDKRFNHSNGCNPKRQLSSNSLLNDAHSSQKINIRSNVVLNFEPKQVSHLSNNHRPSDLLKKSCSSHLSFTRTLLTIHHFIFILCFVLVSFNFRFPKILIYRVC